MTNETKKNENTERSRVSVRLGEFQVELEGTHANVKSLMGAELYTFIKGLQNVVGELPTMETDVREEESHQTEYPPSLGKPPSLGDALKKLLVQEGWGTKPRTLSEIMTALETNALYYEKAAVATVLAALVKSGTLRRLGSRGSFKYVAA